MREDPQATGVAGRRDHGRGCQAALAVLLVTLGAGALQAAPAGRADAEPHRVLLLNSYAAGSRWSVEIVAGVRAELQRHSPRLSLLVDHLAAGPLPPEEVAARLTERLRQEHRREPFALLIAADDAALQFALRSHDELLPGIPLVFCGVSDLPPDLRARHPLATGSLQVRDVSSILATAFHRHPRTRVLTVVHDLSPAGLAYREQVLSWRDEAGGRRGGLEVTFLSSARYSTAELVERIRVLPADGLVLLAAWSRDRDGQNEVFEDVLARVARVCPVPVFGVTGSGNGFLSATARFEEARRQGSLAGIMAVKILQGVPPSEIPIRITRPAPEPDSTEPLPGGRADAVAAVVPGRPALSPVTFLLLCCLATVFQVGLVAMLCLALRRRGQVQRELNAVRQRLAQITDSAGLGVIEWDLAKAEQDVNEHCADALGYAPEEIGSTREAWENRIHPDDRPAVQAAIQDCLDDHRGFYVVRYRVLTRAGTYRWIEERGEVSARAADGSPERLLGVQMDAPSHLGLSLPTAGSGPRRESP